MKTLKTTSNSFPTKNIFVARTFAVGLWRNQGCYRIWVDFS